MKRLALAAALVLAAARVAPGEDLAEDVARLVKKHRLETAAVSVCAVRISSGEVLFSLKGDETFPLASVTKVFTAAAALETLGPGGELATRAWVERGKPGEAALVVVGGGDPGVSGRDHGGNPCRVFELWADDLKAAEITKITGIRLDDTRFGRDRISDQWPKDQLHKWYSAPCGALALNDDCVDVTVTAGKGGAPTVTISPDTAYAKIVNKCVMTADKGSHVVSIWRQPGKSSIVVDGKFWTGAGALTESVTVEDPTLFFGTVLRETLARRGVDAAGAALTMLDAPYRPPFEAGTPLVSATPVPAALQVMLRRSQNFYAEQFLRASAPPGATFAQATAAAKSALAPLGLKDEDLSWVDGSGLARGNRASPATVAKFLAAADGREWGGVFQEALAAPGSTGTLKDRLHGLEDVVRAKTGTISGVSNLAGYVEASGGRIAFAILVSQLKGGSAQGFQDDVVRLLARK